MEFDYPIQSVLMPMTQYHRRQFNGGRDHSVSDPSSRLLTGRQREVVLLATQGLANKNIARRLGITEGTVKVHLHNIFERLGVRNRTALVVWLHKVAID